MALTAVFVDDEPDLCDVYENLFSSDKVRVRAFTDCYEALKFINQSAPEYIFIDYRMPHQSGIEFRNQITSDSACYLITGELDLATPSGFIDVIKKPLREEQFEKIISR